MQAKIRELAGSYQNAICEFLIELINIPSLSRREKAVAARVAEEMTRLGFDSVRIDGLGNVIGRIGNGPRILAFDGHIDTVDSGQRALWEFDPYNARMENGWLTGRGSVDQKGAVASMIYAGKIIKELGLAPDFSLIFTATVMEEDCDGLCWQYLINEEKIKPDFVVITEPTNLGIYRGQRGRMEMTVSVPGLSAHASAPERGVNAIYKMAPVIQQIEKLNDTLHSDSFLGKGSIAVTEVRSNSPSLCAIPDCCSIHLDRRLTWGETKKSALAEIEKIAADHAAKVELLQYNEQSYTGISYPVEKFYPTWKIEADHVLIQAAVDNYKKLFNSTPALDKWTFSTNGVAICGLHAIPCVGFGPGNEVLAHAPNEKIPVEHLVKACAFYAAFPDALLEKMYPLNKLG